MSMHKEIRLEEEVCQHLASHGWLYEPGDWSHYERTQALFTVDLVAWIKDTQPKAWEVLTKNRGGDAQDAVLSRVRQQLDQEGTLAVLRHGIDVVGLKGKLKLAQFKPALALNEDTQKLYS